jgi:hypothetical protein
VMIRRDVALSVGGYGDQKHCADFDLLLRCLERGSGVVLPEVAAIYHVHAQQVSRQREQMKTAHTRIACSYAQRDWFDARQVRRWRAAVAWDLWRAEGGLRRAAALARPGHLPALARLWAWRFRVRRRATRVAPDVRAHMEATR